MGGSITAGLNPFMPSQRLAEDAIIPLSNELSRSNPLDFLSNDRQAMQAGPLSNIAPLQGVTINDSPQSPDYLMVR